MVEQGFVDGHDHDWYWAWRWADTNEPAFMVSSAFPLTRRELLKMICNAALIDVKRPVHAAMISAEQWHTWFAFDLCPAIRVYDESHWLSTLFPPRLKWKRMTA